MYGIFDLIEKNKESMSKSQKQLAEYILENKIKISFFNIKTLAKNSGISEATIVRFCNSLGFKGYPQLKEKIQQELQQRITMQERLNISRKIYSDKESFVKEIIKEDAKHVENLLNNFDDKTFFTIVEEMLKMKRICIVAGRSTVAVGKFMYYYFNLIFDDVCLVSSIDEATEKYKYFNQDTLAFGITFSRYSKSTLKIMEYAKKQNCITASLTDNFSSPIVPMSDYTLIAETEMPSIFDTYVAPLALINAMVGYICHIKNIEINKNLEKSEKLWKEFDIFKER